MIKWESWCFVRVVFWVCSFCCLAGDCSAQLDNSAFYLEPTAPLDTVGSLGLRLNALGYNRNNEYFHPFEIGRTWFGYQVFPEMAYQLHEDVQVFGGIYFRQDFGNEAVEQVQPLFRVQASFDSLLFVFGNIYGNVQHRLPEPMFAFERLIFDRQEEGVQLLWKKNGWDADAWLDWQTMIYPGDDKQEEIWAGLTLFKMLKSGPYYAEPGLGFTIFHEGGQIDSTDRPLRLFLSSFLQAKFGRTFASKRLHALEFTYQWLHFDDIWAGEQVVQFEHGLGHFFTLYANSKWGGFMLNYYRSFSYFTQFGSGIYSAEGLNGGEIVFPSRELLFFRTLADIHFGDHATLTLRFEPYYDFTRSRFEFSNSLYFSVREFWKLGRKKRS